MHRSPQNIGLSHFFGDGLNKVLDIFIQVFRITWKIKAS